MKRITFLLILICLISILLTPTTAFASVDIEQQDWEDIILSNEEYTQILSMNPNNSISTSATTLIDDHKISISKKITF